MYLLVVGTLISLYPLTYHFLHPFVTPFVSTSGNSGSSIITSIASGAAGLLAAYSALRISKRDTNAEDLKKALADKTSLQNRLDDFDADMLDVRAYIFNLRALCADKGIATPEPPTMRTERRG